MLKITEENYKGCLHPEIRCAHLSSDGKNLLVGTFGGEIYEMMTKDAKINTSTRFTGVKPLMRSHYAPNNAGNEVKINKKY